MRSPLSSASGGSFHSLLGAPSSRVCWPHQENQGQEITGPLNTTFFLSLVNGGHANPFSKARRNELKMHQSPRTYLPAWAGQSPTLNKTRWRQKGSYVVKSGRGLRGFHEQNLKCTVLCQPLQVHVGKLRPGKGQEVAQNTMAKADRARTKTRGPWPPGALPFSLCVTISAEQGLL